jgi:ABC-2 type transport system ATP-binding protein
MKRISLNAISKTFHIGSLKREGVLASFISLFSPRKSEKIFQALQSVSLDIESGEIVGITGNNGSGKSTLLRIIADIYKADSGSVAINGRIISIINLGIGFMERLTMSDNIYLVGTLFGMSNKDIRDSFDSIVAFSELEEFVDTKIYQFSAGMIQRLAFSLAIHSKPEVLLLDEVFEVGDEGFKKKSAAEIQRLVSNGASVLLVSHDLDIIQRYCNRVLEMSEGKIISNTKQIS